MAGASTADWRALRAARRAYLFAERNIINRAMRTLIERGLAPNAFAVLETTGRRTSEPHRTPVGNGLLGDAFWVIAERGTRADYVRNLQQQPRVRVLVDGQWHTGTATVLPDDDVGERVQAILAGHPDLARRLDAKLLDLSVAVYGSSPLTVRIDLDRERPNQAHSNSS